jgi:branched-chain amino acid aminotransferase
LKHSRDFVPADQSIIQTGVGRMTNNGKFVWLNNQVVPWSEAKIHVNSLGVLGGLNVYEVIKGYWNKEQDELFLFRLDFHFARLTDSMKMVRMRLPYSMDELRKASLRILRENAFHQDVALRIGCYFGEGPLSAYEPDEIQNGAFIFVQVRDPIPFHQGVHCCVSSWRRISDSTAPPRIKTGTNYHNVRLASVQARVDRYDQPILLNEKGEVAESPIYNVMLVRNGVLITPDLGSGILEGITRATLLELARKDLGIPVEERRVNRTELYVADEIFLTATTTEVLSVLSVDRIPVGNGAPGPVGQALYRALTEAATGRNPRYHPWCTPVYRSSFFSSP